MADDDLIRRGDAIEAAEVLRLRGEVAALTAANAKLAAEQAQLWDALTEAEKEIVALRTAFNPKDSCPAEAFNNADWFWRTMDPEDCGDTPEEAINRSMLGRFCVCEIASSYAGPTRYGFIAPVLDPESDDEEFVHFATQQEAIEAAKARAFIAGEGK